MKTAIKALVLALSISTLAGCAGTPPTPPAQLTDADLCSETGYAYQQGNTGRLSALMAEGKGRAARHTLQIDKVTCDTLAQAGQRRAVARQQEQAAASAASARNWSNAAAGASAAFNQIQVQQQQQQMQQQQAMQQAQQQAWQQQQYMQQSQQTQALQDINRTLRGY
jgi:hypothetical protein